MWCSSNTRQQIEAIESSLQLPETRLIISTINHIPYNRRKAIKCPNLSFNAKKGGGREASPFFKSIDGSVPSTGQRRPGLPRADPAVLSARWGLASGFGTGPGVPPMLWPLTGGRRPPYLRCPVSHSRALGAAWRIGGSDSGASSCPDRASERSVPRAARCGSGRARAISAARLRTSPPLHLPSIDQVVYLGPYRKEN